MRPEVRVPQNAAPDVESLARDTQEALTRIPGFEIVEVTEVYAEPMVIAFDHEPAGVQLIRIQEDENPEEPVATGGLLSFTFVDDGVRIDAIEGPNVGTRYRFKFLMIG